MINLRSNLIKVLFAAIILLPSISFSAPFLPGQTLDPLCVPLSSPDCTVSTSSAYSSFVPYVGASSTLDLGNQDLFVNNISASGTSLQLHSYDVDGSGGLSLSKSGAGLSFGDNNGGGSLTLNSNSFGTSFGGSNGGASFNLTPNSFGVGFGGGGMSMDPNSISMSIGGGSDGGGTSISATHAVFSLGGGNSTDGGHSLNISSAQTSISGLSPNNDPYYNLTIDKDNGLALSFSTTTPVLTVLTNGNVGIGTSTPSQALTVNGNLSLTGAIFDSTNASGTSGMLLLSTGTSTKWSDMSSVLSSVNNFSITASSIATTTPFVSFNSATSPIFNVLSNGNVGIGTSTPTSAFEVVRYSSFSTQSLINVAYLQAITYGNGLFVAVTSGGVNPNRIITSPDGINWTPQVVLENEGMRSITYGNGLFVAVANASAGTHFVMTSPDGINWTPQTAAENNGWLSVTYGNGQFVAVSWNGTHRVMTSPDGITWTPQNIPNSWWNSITYGNGTFVAVSPYSPCVATSPDGVNWSTSTVPESNQWNSVTYGNGKFIAVAGWGVHRVMTSPDGIDWTAYNAAEQNQWETISYGDGLFVAGSRDGTNKIMTSPDGINWSIQTGPGTTYSLNAIAYGNNKFIGVVSTTIVTLSKVKTFSVNNDGSVSIPSLGTGIVMVSTSGSLYTIDSNSYQKEEVLYHYNTDPLLYWSGTGPKVVKTISVPESANYGAWDGENFWSTNFGGNSVSKINQDGEILATYNFSYLGGISPIQAAFDGRNMWIASADCAANLIKFDTVLATTTGVFTLNPTCSGYGGIQGIVWDGTNIWVGVAQALFPGPTSGFVAKINPTTGAVIASTTGQTNVNGLAITDIRESSGIVRYIWAADEGFISKIKASDMTYQTFPSGGTTYRIATDGTYIYGADWNNTSDPGKIYKYLAKDGSLVAKWDSGNGLNAIAFDGKYIWVAGGANTVTIHDRDTGAILYTLSDAGESDLVFDGSYMWSISASTQQVNKISIGNQMGNLKVAQSLSIMDDNANTSLFLSGTSTKNSFMLSNLGIGTSTPSTNLQVEGGLRLTGSFFDSTNTTGIAGMVLQSTGTSTLWADINSITGKAGYVWTSATSSEQNSWQSVTYGNGLFVAVASNGTHQVMTSPDGITWTSQTAAEQNGWHSVTYGNGLFVAVGGGTHTVMTSPDGITWTSQTAPDSWASVTYGNGLFVAVGGNNSGTNEVMTSSDGVHWTTSSAPGSGFESWYSVTYGNGLFVAISYNGTHNVMTSPDGENWTLRDATEVDPWFSITYGNGLFVAVSISSGQVMISPDGINWTLRNGIAGSSQTSITYGNGMFVVVSQGGSSYVVTSGKPDSNIISTKNIYQGGMSIFGNVGIGTSTPTANLTVVGTIQFSSLGSLGANLITDSAGNVTVSSDERLKNISGTFDRGLSAVEGLTPINYHWNATSGLDTINQYTGFSAQNVQENIPEAVATDSRGYLTLADRPIIAVLVNAVKEIGSFITKIENGIAYLTNIVVEKFTVGSDATPAGITMYDEVTKLPYCVKVKNGILFNESGICSKNIVTSTIIDTVTVLIPNAKIIISTSTLDVPAETISTTTPEIIPDVATTTEVIITPTTTTPVEEVATTTVNSPTEILLAPLEEATTTTP